MDGSQHRLMPPAPSVAGHNNRFTLPAKCNAKFRTALSTEIMFELLLGQTSKNKTSVIAVMAAQILLCFSSGVPLFNADFLC